MSLRVAIEHRTVYRFDRAVRLHPHVIRLRPAPHCRTPILAYSLTVAPGEHFINWQQDPSGNHLARCVFPQVASELAITVDLVADMTAINPFDFFIDKAARSWPFSYEAALRHDLAPYLATSDDQGPLLAAWVAELPRSAPRTIDFLVECNQRVRDCVAYSVRMEAGVQTPEVTLERGVGSCRDSAWLLVAALRALGIAARFASGYLVQLVPDLEPAAKPGCAPLPPGPRADFTDLHAWAEAYVPGAGWIGLDATSGLLAGEGHIPLACTSSPAAAAPVQGAVDPCETEFEFANHVRRIDDEARPSRPYTPAQWARIDALGRYVDDVLQTGDVRLTMGGEPTFVAAQGTDAPEWNFTALSPRKHRLAAELTLGLAGALTHGALIQHGQGKWYPGEPLPRWQIGVVWRKDGHALWGDPALLADPTAPGSTTTAQAAALAAAIAVEFGLEPDACVPAFEDPIGLLWNEARLPYGEPPTGPAGEEPSAALASVAQRARIVAALDAERGEPVGTVIPLHRAPGEPTWSSGRWTLRRRHLFLIAGDSPLGLRLPLGSIAWTPPPADPDQSLFVELPPLPPEPAPAQTQVSLPAPITALCVQQRDGHAHVFLPPLKDFAHFVELVGLIERAAAATATPVVVEGYAPPGDTRMSHFVVTPDPGVIEVNIHPSRSWPDLVHTTTTIYAQAAKVGLAAEKFELDGIYTATGGGSHITLGGPTPADSPLLRRPDLLRSLLTYWQHHPSLSYLFSGRFVGPTCQAPRVDEGRHEALYEFEIAFAELDRLHPAAPWVLDRLFRNLLIDLSGNTHRAEFCIDKLFSPESERGRLGLLELRGFEMAPHPQMALVQTLLVRALVARMWNAPYRESLVRWGTELHDRFLLPWWLAADIRAVAEDLQRHGHDFDPAWIDPFIEFRFPLLGSVHVDGVELELRAAIEPWNVLGEDAAAGSSRSVDSSVERLQVRVDGMTSDRHTVTCNGRQLPLAPTATPGTYVAGVRYRAWQLPNSLHPTIGVHSPLHFDLIDRWAGRSLGGATYHVTHPGGLAHELLPSNAADAQARRASRFSPIGHTPGPIELAPPGPAGEYPRTLDLRRATATRSSP